MIKIRQESPEDVSAIHELHKCAFEQEQEANIVDALRSNDEVRLSLVATVNGPLVGHIMYSPISIGGQVTGAALGPMAVLSEHQRKGIGSELVKRGNERLKNEGWPFIIVLGHAEYYPRFGFRPASTYGVACEWEVPDNVFMLLVLDDKAMRGVSGLAKYRQEFTSVS